MNMSMIFTFLGGVGLFLLGMKLMTDGLKVAAGDALREILARGTATTPRGIVSGIGITAIVQSSSAVIFATIGFVNAGLLTLFQAVGVIIGSNVGTTATSWLVALVGFKVNLQALAMPAIAVGMLMRVTGSGTRRASLGDALTGFGIFFLGLDILKVTFDGFGDTLNLAQYAGYGVLSLLTFAIVGIVLTVVMNSSSAALAVTLTAAGTGLIPLNAAAAMVIGANVGTTSTALFAVIGATSSAKRAAMAHLLFNAVTGVVAFILLPFLLWLVVQIALGLGLEPSPATFLAIFHTMTKLIGMAIFWPLTPRVVSFLEARFRSAEEDEGKPRHLDKNIASTPDLALEALNMELNRIGEMARRGVGDALSAEGSASLPRLIQERNIIDRLILAVGEFTNRAQYGEVPAAIADGFTLALRISQYYGDIAENSIEMARLQASLPPVHEEAIAAALFDFKRQSVSLVSLTDPEREDFSMKPLKQALKAFEDDYQAMKAMLLRAGVDGRLPVRQMAARLDEISTIRRIVDQAFKAAKHSHKLRKKLYRYKGGWSAENSNNDEQQGENGVRLAHGIESKAPLSDANGSASAVQTGAPDLGEQKQGDVIPANDKTDRLEAGRPTGS